MSGLMAGKSALVTGAGSGIGAATARLLAAEGARVAVGYHNDRARAEAVIAGLAGAGHLCVRIKIDDSQSLWAAAEVVGAAFGHLDLLVNSGGSTLRVPAANLEELTDVLFDEVMAINLRGPFAVIRAVLPLLQRAPAGAAIVSVGSLAAHTGVGSNLAYAAAKAGLITLSKGLARVLGPSIRVLTVSPAGVETDFVKGRDPAVSLRNAAATPLRKQTFPDDVASTILACAALMPSATGIDIVVDEGRSLVGWPL
jgi:3-oxoacyl-[acyl-carrier protein] reductase